MGINYQPAVFERQIQPDTGIADLIAPTPIVAAAEVLLPRHAQVLDLGAYNGRNGFYLARNGHEVTSVELETEYIEAGRRIAASLGAIGLRNTFMQGDMSKLAGDFNNFDAAIATISLHMLTRTASSRTLAGIKNSVKARGFNIIESYVATPEQQALVPHRTLFSPNELFRRYREDGWEVIDQVNRTGAFSRNEDGTYRFSSCDSLIARRPAPRRATFMNAKREIIEV